MPVKNRHRQPYSTQEAELHTAANVKSIKTADELLGTLIDIRA